MLEHKTEFNIKVMLYQTRGVIQMSDPYGVFAFMPYYMWEQCVLYPYNNHFKKEGKSIHEVVKIFAGAYGHQYCCLN